MVDPMDINEILAADEGYSVWSRELELDRASMEDRVAYERWVEEQAQTALERSGASLWV
jgi:hypothetical protein